MKTKKLLNRILAFFKGEEKMKKKDEKAALAKLVRKLKAKEEELAKKLAEPKSEEKAEKHSRKLALVKLQREKGEKALAELEGESGKP